jgi:hypothetical protein
MGSINRVPKGLLSILDSQTMGDNPGDMSPIVQASMDVTRNYLAAKGWESVSAFATVVAGSASYTVIAPLTVPDGEFWLMRQVTFQAQPQSGIPNCFFGVNFFDSSNALIPICLAQTAQILVATQTGFGYLVPAHFPYYLTLTAGNVLAGYINQTPLVSDMPCATFASITRFRA